MPKINNKQRSKAKSFKKKNKPPTPKNKFKKIRQSAKKQIQDTSHVSPYYIDYKMNCIYPGTSNAILCLDDQTPVGGTIPVNLKNSFSISQASDLTTLQPLGTNRYTVICYNPYATASHSSSVSGLTIFQSSSSSTPFSSAAITGFSVVSSSSGTAGINTEVVIASDQNIAANVVYGSNPSSIGSHGSCWAGGITLSAIAPNVNIVGKGFEGYLTYGQFVAEDGSMNTVSIDDLIKQSARAFDFGGEVNLRAAVTNTATLLRNHPQTNNSTVSTARRMIQGQNLGEVVHYVVLQDYVQSISVGSTSANQGFSFIGSTHSNWVIWSSIDAMSRSLTKEPKPVRVKVPTKVADEISDSPINIIRPTIKTIIDNYPDDMPHAGRIKRFVRPMIDNGFDGNNSPGQGNGFWSGVVSNLPTIAAIVGSAVTTASVAMPFIRGAAKAGMFLADENKPQLYNNYELDTWFNLQKRVKLQHSGLPKYDAIVTRILLILKEVEGLLQEEWPIVYPLPQYDTPENFVVPGNALATWKKLDKDKDHPIISRGTQNPFILTYRYPGDKEWFDEFIYAYEFGEEKSYQKTISRF